MRKVIIHELAGKIGFLKAYVEENVNKFDEEFISMVANIDLLTRYLSDTHLGEEYRPRKRKVNLKELLEESVLELDLFARIKGVKFLFSGCDDVNLYTDPFILSRVFFNLLHNSVKFSPHGGKVMLVCRREDSRTAVTIENEVSDEEPHRGTGMGMEISSDLLNLIGGKLEARRSTSRFRVTVYVQDG
ncbi:MAG: hypothetical protein Q9N26_08550 [Aquificota bacterium]|nr:hypothetical protein [Aquificota bacterium]